MAARSRVPGAVTELDPLGHRVHRMAWQLLH